MIELKDIPSDERELMHCHREAGTFFSWIKRTAKQVEEWEGPKVEDGRIRHQAFVANRGYVAKADREIVRILKSLNHNEVKAPLVKFSAVFWRDAMALDDVDIILDRAVALAMLRLEDSSDIGKLWRGSGCNDMVSERELKKRGLL